MTKIPIGKWWLPMAVTIGVFAVTGFLWRSQTTQEQRHIKQILTKEHQSIVLNIQTHLRYRVEALQRMANRWSVMGKPQRAEWEHDARENVEHFGDFQALEWVDPSYRVRWVIPHEGNEQVVGMASAFDPVRRAALDAARTSQQPVMTTPIDLVQGGKGFLVYCPIYSEEHFEGFILGVFRFDKIFQDITGSKDWGAIHPKIKVGRVWVLGGGQVEDETRGTRLTHHQESLTLYGAPWTIALTGSDEIISDARSTLKALIVAIGGAIGVLLVILICQAQVLRWRAVELTRTNKQLTSEVATRKRTERELLASEMRKTSILNAALDCIITIDHKGKIIEFNPAAEKTFGYPREQILGRSLVETIIPPEYREAHNLGMTRYLTTGNSNVLGTRIELTAQHRDGSVFPIELGIIEIKTDHGPPVFTGFLRDISERKKNQATLRRSEELFRKTIEASPASMVLVNREGVITLINKQTEEMFGYTREELLGQKVERLIPPALRDTHVGYRNTFFDTPGAPQDGERAELIGAP